MPRTQKVVRPGETKGEIIDTVLLKYEDRIKQQGFVFGGKGTCVEFDFPAPPLLRRPRAIEAMRHRRRRN